MAASAAQVLPEGAGWAIVVAIAIGFSFIMLGIIWIQKKQVPTGEGAENSSNDEFSSASRSIKPGLLAAAICSAWTWSATLEQSAAVGYKYGVSGPFWYAGGATVQILLFAIIASNAKLNAPFAHTYLSVVRERWGKLAHCIFMLFALGTNVLVSSMLVLGGSSTVNHLTGMPTLAACFLTPVGIAIYVMLGGLRSSLIADYIHTSVLIAIILAFAITVYGTSDKIGSFSKMYELLERADPVEGNGGGGTYLTFRSLPAFEFGMLNILGNFATVFADQAYFQRAVASKGDTATKGFLLGGLAWFAIPMTIASSLGLAGRALVGKDPDMVELSAMEISEGLPAPAAAAALLGKSGALMMLILLFLAVTSAASAQMVAVSSIITYDIFLPYIKTNATARQLFICSHAGIAIWAIIMGLLGLIWNYIGISMGWLYTCLGVLVGAAVFPIFCCTTWGKANRTSALVGIVSGMVLGIFTWLISSWALEGALSIDATGTNHPLLAGSFIAVGLPVLIMVPWSLIYPENYDWEGTRSINAPWNKPFSSDSTASAAVSNSGSSTPVNDGEKDKAGLEAAATALDQTPELGVEDYDRLTTLRQAGIDPENLIKSRRMAIRASVAMTLILVILVPSMAIIPAKWTVTGLGVWISIMIGSLFCSGLIVVVYPIWESRHALGEIVRLLSRPLLSRK
ncbi:unnamed protein product [Sympodiomycopsis kandeliae]